MYYVDLKNQGMNETSFAVLQKAAKRVLSLRKLDLSDAPDAYTVTLSVDKGLEHDRFIIRAEENGAVLTAANDCDLHAAFGRLLRASAFDGKGGFVPLPAGEIIDFTPKSLLRGMYFATHFSNFYHAAPLAEVYEVIEDIALKGCNSLLVWFDMHHFTSMHTPEAQEYTERLRAILKYANGIGMGGSLTMLANESFAGSPEALRADWHARNGYRTSIVDHYHVEICPNKEGGVAEILKMRREMLSAFSDLRIDYIIYWSYDQGGCTCEKCAPWGYNGFLKLFPHFKKLIKEIFPNAEPIVSTWLFDRYIDGEWEGFYQKLGTELFSDVTYILSFFENGKLPECIEKNGIPDGVQFLDFPEISMYSCLPWGGFGASHLAAFLDRTNRNAGKLYGGCFCYSEGVFEDANKFIELSYYSGENEDAFEALRAYVKYEFCCEDAALYEAVKRTETALRKFRKDGDYTRAIIEDASDVEFVYETLSHYNEVLPKHIASSRNFRLYYLRSVIDREMVFCDGYPERSPVCREAMNELCRIYHADGRTHRWVRPFLGPWNE